MGKSVLGEALEQVEEHEAGWGVPLVDRLHMAVEVVGGMVEVVAVYVVMVEVGKRVAVDVDKENIADDAVETVDFDGADPFCHVDDQIGHLERTVGVQRVIWGLETQEETSAGALQH